jgi:hypothetical protein
MIFILNSILTVVFYVTRLTKLDIVCIYFEEFRNQLNLFYICSRTRVMRRTSCAVDQIFLSRQVCTVSKIVISFHGFNFGVIFIIHLRSMFILSYKKIYHHSINLNFII